MYIHINYMCTYVHYMYYMYIPLTYKSYEKNTKLLIRNTRVRVYNYMVLNIHISC